MKKITINFFCFLIAALSFVLINGCNKNKELTLPKFPNFFGSINIPQAANPIKSTMLIGGNDTTFSFNVVAVGDHSIGHEHDIKVTIQAMPQLVDSFNMKNGTNYSALPEDSYKLTGGDAVIKAKRSQSDSIKLNVSVKNFIKKDTFLLPVGILNMDNPNFIINSQSDIIYFIIMVDRLPLGKKVLHLDNIDNNSVECFQFRNNLMVFSQGILSKYVYNSTTEKFVGPTQVADPNFGYGNNKNFITISSKYLMCILANDFLMGVNGTNIDNNTFSYSPNANAISSGFSVFNLVVGYKGSILARGNVATGYSSPGVFSRYSVDTSSASLTLAGQTNLGGGWDAFTQIISYGDGLLCMTSTGDLYFYPISDNFSVSPKEKVGSGWSKFRAITSFGKYLLGIDKNNDVYRFNFDITKQWDL